MKLVEIGKLCKLQNGKAFKPTEWSDNGLPIVRIQNLNNEDKPFNYCNFDVDKKFHIDSGDLLFSWSGTPGTSFGAFFWHRGPAILNQHIFNVLIDESLVRKDYFRLAMNAKLDEIIAQAHGGVGLQHITKGKLEAVKIPLPPLETQKQIAAVLEKADQLRKDCQQMEQELNSLAQSVFIDMFGDPVTNPKGWDKAPLSAIVDEFLGGKSLVAADDQNTEYKNRVLKISAVTSGEFKPRESKPLPNDYEPQVEHFVKAGDLLFSRANTTELVGATTMVFDEHTGLVLPDKLWRFVWKDEKSLSPVFIWQQLCEAGVRKEISKLSSGSGGSMKNISKGKLNTLQIIFPPLELQQKFERIYLKLRVELSNNQQQIKFADQAFNALMQKAFKGELNL